MIVELLEGLGILIIALLDIMGRIFLCMGLLSLWIGTVAICTKPKIKDFKKHVLLYLQNDPDNYNCNHNPNTDKLVDFMQTKNLKSAIDSADWSMIDIGVCRLCEIQLNGQEMMFLGVFNHWYKYD